MDDPRGELVHINVDAAAHDQAKGPQIIDAVGVVGVGWLNSTPSSRFTPARATARASRGGVDEDRGHAARPQAFDEHGTAAATVFRIRGIAGAPPLTDPGHAAGRAAAENCQTQAQCDDSTACGGLPPAGSSLEKSLSVLARVAAASASNSIPRARRPRQRSRRQRPAHCGGRDRASARDKAHRSRPGGGRAGHRARWRASPPTS